MGVMRIAARGTTCGDEPIRGTTFGGLGVAPHSLVRLGPKKSPVEGVPRRAYVVDRKRLD